MTKPNFSSINPAKANQQVSARSWKKEAEAVIGQSMDDFYLKQMNKLR